MQQFDTLIVGQGIAGSLVAFELHKQQQTFRVLDAGHHNSASRVAAGMYTPVSGKRKTISPLFFEQSSHAISTYQQIEALLKCSILHQADVHQLVDNEAEKQLLFEKSLLPEYQDVIELTADGGDAMIIKYSGWVNSPLFVNSFRQWLQNNTLLFEEMFDYNSLQLHENHFEYKDNLFRNIIFCEGYRAGANPFFTAEIIPCKGDIISIDAGHQSTNAIVKKGAFYMLPLQNGALRVGATFKFHNTDEQLFDADRKQLEAAAESMLGERSFTVLQHQSAIRATTAGQQVIAKQHPFVKNMFMLNGLGSKGILLGPWHAAKLVKQILTT